MLTLLVLSRCILGNCQLTLQLHHCKFSHILSFCALGLWSLISPAHCQKLLTWNKVQSRPKHNEEGEITRDGVNGYSYCCGSFCHRLWKAWKINQSSIKDVWYCGCCSDVWSHLGAVYLKKQLLENQLVLMRYPTWRGKYNAAPREHYSLFPYHWVNSKFQHLFQWETELEYFQQVCLIWNEWGRVIQRSLLSGKQVPNSLKLLGKSQPEYDCALCIQNNLLLGQWERLLAGSENNCKQ